MRAARPEGSAPVINAKAESLPFDDNSFDGAMACITIHHWDDPEAGLREMRRVAKGPVVVLTLDLPHHIAWQRDYLAPLLEADLNRFPSPPEIARILGKRTRIDALRTPVDCSDGFIDAYWARPEAFLDRDVRAAQSGWALLPPGLEDQIIARLSADLESGTWEEQHGHIRAHADYDGALRLIVDDPGVNVDFPRRI
jgi:SAM-dependent methyltransferase